MTEILSVRDLKKSYKRGVIPKRTEVLKGMSFSVPAGTVTGFLGANGAGKTTTMRCILGLDFADSGEVNFFGQPLNQASRAKIGFLPERPYFYEHLTGREFLAFYAKLTSAWKKNVLRDRIEQLLAQVDLTHAGDRLLRNYSKGMLQKIGVAQSLIHDPELIILDEPMSGLDPDGRLALTEIILDTAKRGPAIFFSSHLLHDMEKLCSRLVVMKEGAVIFEGQTEQLLDASSTEIEISTLKNGQRQTDRAPNQESAQKLLNSLVNDGALVLELRRVRPTLEEIFVKMALKGGRR